MKNINEITQRDYWNNLKKFENPEDVPKIPIVPADEYNNFYLPRLIEAGAIQKKDLIDGKVYIGKHRRCNRARWNAKNNKFEYWRYKFGFYLDECNHFEDDDGYALFVPIRLDENQNFEMPK